MIWGESSTYYFQNIMPPLRDDAVMGVGDETPKGYAQTIAAGPQSMSEGGSPTALALRGQAMRSTNPQ